MSEGITLMRKPLKVSAQFLTAVSQTLRDPRKMYRTIKVHIDRKLILALILVLP